jgi:acyl-CoA thioester hydrolase
MEKFCFFYPLRVRWSEVDLQAIVFNGHYLTYFDVAITEYYRNIGIVFPEGITELGCDIFVKKATLEYHSPARYDDELQIYVRCARMGNSSFQFLWEIRRKEELLVSGETISVNTDLETRRPQGIPKKFRALIEDFEIHLGK